LTLYPVTNTITDLTARTVTVCHTRQPLSGTNVATFSATDLMLYILSLDGQATLKRFGFRPVGLPTPSEP
jgi:hypothetical protein